MRPFVRLPFYYTPPIKRGKKLLAAGRRTHGIPDRLQRDNKIPRLTIGVGTAKPHPKALAEA
jgi:hypothetical protein